MNTVDDIFTAYAKTFEAHREAEMSLAEYLDACKKDPVGLLDRDRTAAGRDR